VPPARVADYAGLLSAAGARRLEGRLAERERATGTQMVIAIFSSLEGESLEDYGIRLAEQWRIGQKGLDNGVIVLVFVRERRVRLEVGYGLEAAIPDAVAGQIIREAIAPRFREGRYAAGLEAAIDAVYARVEGRPVPAARGRHASNAPVWSMAALFVIIAVLLLREVMSPMRRAPRAGWTATRSGWSAPTVVYPWWGSGGGGGSSGGGGFAGGGGSFGGGGASGGW